MFGFEKLEVWGKAIDFVDAIYVVTRTFPTEERFGLTSQLRRASVSISANIAEGSGRTSKKDFAHFIEIAYGSLMKVVSEMRVSQRQSLIKQDQHKVLYSQAEQLARMLSGLRASLQRGT